MDDETFTRIDDFWFRVEAALDQEGYFVVAVGSTRTNPSWAYTIGLLEHGFPELVTIGLSPASAHAFLDFAFQQMTAGAPLREGRQHRRVCWNDLPLSVIPLERERFWPPSELISAWYGYYAARGGQLPANPEVSQLVWPDMAGRLPWDPGFDEAMRRYQPLLDEVPWAPNDDGDDDACCCEQCCFFAEDERP